MVKNVLVDDISSSFIHIRHHVQTKELVVACAYRVAALREAFTYTCHVHTSVRSVFAQPPALLRVYMWERQRQRTHTCRETESTFHNSRAAGERVARDNQTTKLQAHKHNRRH